MQKLIRVFISRTELAIKRIFRDIILIGTWISIERKSPVKLSLWQRWQALRHGFFTESYALFFPDGQHNYTEYFSDYQQSLKMPVINERNGILLADKTIFYDFMSPFHAYIPPLYGVIKQGKIVSLPEKYKIQHFEDIEKLLSEEKVLVFKPVSDYGGNGVIVPRLIEDQLFINQKLSDFGTLARELTRMKHYMIVKFVEQHEYARRIFSGSTNSIRILTMIDPETQEAFIADIFHRFGTNKSIPVDNWKQGGVLTHIDIETGMLGDTIYRSTDKKLLKMSFHPDSEAPVKGVIIPNWEFIKAKILEMAKFAYHCPYIGWDVVPQENGFYILEGNDCPNVTQLYNPMLANPKIRKFYQFYGVVK
jgi:glutathione synthase/RimK-type ligase-like ATP-grasp enzyme